MKKVLSLLFTVLVLLQTGTAVTAFYDENNSPFNTKKYNHDDKFKNCEIIHGLDLSYYQSDADFTKLKDAGVDFVILRAAYRGYGSKGTLSKDSCFDKFVTAALNQGLDVGAYIYSQAITKAEAVEEANYILNIVKGYNITMPIVFDFEYAPGGKGRLYNANLSKSQKTAICNAFCKQVESKGYTAMVYANQSMLTDDLNDNNIAKNYDIWLANYSTSPKYGGKLYDCDYTIWQYTSEGRCNGVSGNVDCNFRYYKKPNKVTNLAFDESLEKTTLSWDKIKGVYGYEIYRLNKETEKYEKIATVKGASATAYTDTTVQGMPSSYKVRAVTPYKGNLAGGAYSDTVTTPGVFIINIKSTDAVSSYIEWTPYKDATEYEILRAESENGVYSTVGTVDKATTEFNDLTNDGFKTYYYKIKATFEKSETPSDPQYSVIKEVKKQQPTSCNAILKTNTSAQISWTLLNGASGTEIWRKSGNEDYKLIKTFNNAKTDTFTNKKLIKGTVYKYKIRQFSLKNGVKYYSSFTGIKTVKPMKKAEIELKSYKNKVKISVKKVDGASGYEYYIKSGKKYTLIKASSKRSYNKTKLLRYSKYSFKVRAYKKVGNTKVYAPFSKVKSIKTK